MTVFLTYLFHLDDYLNVIIQQYGVWAYVILFLVIFFETGLVVTPFLPGDSLLFAAGAFAARGSLEVVLIFALLSLGAIVGDATNYWIGNFIGPRIFRREKGKWFNRDHLAHTQTFYEKHGKKTIILARFIPVVRTFAPFIAGVGKMPYRTFAAFNVIGGVLWVAIFVFGGFYFGSIPAVKSNFELVIMGLIVLSLVPVLIEWMRHRRKK